VFPYCNQIKIFRNLQYCTVVDISKSLLTSIAAAYVRLTCWHAVAVRDFAQSSKTQPPVCFPRLRQQLCLAWLGQMSNSNRRKSNFGKPYSPPPGTKLAAVPAAPATVPAPSPTLPAFPPPPDLPPRPGRPPKPRASVLDRHLATWIHKKLHVLPHHGCCSKNKVGGELHF
jgi:hypothetical protein